MNLSSRSQDLLERLEGREPTVYLDAAGLPTIGAGHCLTRDEITSGKIRIGNVAVHYRYGLTDEQIDALLAQDVAPVEQAVDRLVDVPLMQCQFDALVVFAFNVGTDALARSTLLRRLNGGDYADVPNQLRRWVWAAGRRVRGLVNRREAEIRLWKEGAV